MDEREFYRIGFQSIETARITVFVEERQNVGIAHLDLDKLFRRARLPRGRDRRGGTRTSKPSTLAAICGNR
jgi:hypothetical protein